MNPKIAKLREEHEKNRAKIAELQARDRELMRQLRELENTEIIGLVRSQGLQLEDFAALMHGMQKPMMPIIQEQTEENTDDAS